MHAFGAYFGMAITVVMSRKNYSKAGDEKNDTTPTSDIFSLLGVAKNKTDLVAIPIYIYILYILYRLPSALVILAKLQWTTGRGRCAAQGVSFILNSVSKPNIMIYILYLLE